MGFKVKGNRLRDDEKVPPRNDVWIMENRLKANQWLNDNEYLFGNNKPFSDTAELFFNLSEFVLFLAVRYPNWAKKGNISHPLSLNVLPKDFETNLKNCMETMKSIKRAFKSDCKPSDSENEGNPTSWMLR